MNYVQALFSVFNAPLFATFIVGMFWKRMTAAAGFWSSLSGTVAAIATYLLYLAGALPFDSDLEESFCGAGIAFVLVVVVAFVMSVYGMGGVDLKGDVIAGDAAWYRSPLLLGGVALALSIALYIPLW